MNYRSEVAIYYLNNQIAARKLDVHLDGEVTPFNITPTYLDLPLDRSLTFKPELKPRITLAQKLVRTD